jgi:uncharacterized protein with von Willebrand factor type A (vWA) domain
MRFIYHEWDGTEFPTQDHLQSFKHFMDLLLEYGDEALKALRRAEEDAEQRKIIEQWILDGLLEKIGVRFKLTPRAIQSIQRKALMEVFRNLKPDSSDGHESAIPGAGGERSEGTRTYQFGDPADEIDVTATLRNAIQRMAADPEVRRGATTRVPIKLAESDFEIHQTEARAVCSTVILLDMSGSMGRWGRFTQAKKCAMALYALIRQRFPRDTVEIVGFASGAEVVPEHRLPLLMPKRVSLFDPQVRLRVPLAELASAPQHFTNLQMGLMTARRLLSRRGARNKQVFLITDGEPTAHLEGSVVHLVYPPDPETAVVTLSEALLLTRQGIRLATFALIDDYFAMDWVGFVDHLTKLARGVAFYCTSGNLSQCIMESYLSGRKRKTFLS